MIAHREAPGAGWRTRVAAGAGQRSRTTAGEPRPRSL